MNRTSALRRAAAGVFPLAALVLSACLGGPNISVTTQAPQDHPSPDGPACVARVTLTTPPGQGLDRFEVTFGYWRDAAGKDQLAAVTAERIPPGASREIEGTLAPTPCAALTLMRDPVVTQCRQGDDDCRGAIVLNGGSD